MINKRLILSRLQKQQKLLQQDPIPNVLVTRKGLLNFHFCIYGLDTPFKGGYYHGVLQLHEEYPFSPPRLLFYTPSGKFQINKPICTTFTNFHKEAWTSAWNVRTMITATVSFMTGSQGGLGSLNDNSIIRQKYASQSLSYNLKNQQFCNLFKQKLLKNNITITQSITNTQDSVNSPKKAVAKSNILFFWYVLLIIVIVFWMLMKG